MSAVESLVSFSATNKLEFVPISELFGLSGIPERFTAPRFTESKNHNIPKSKAEYVFRKEFIREFNAFMMDPSGDAFYISGPTGSGKTSGVTEAAARMAWPVQQITAHGRLEMNDLIGHYALKASKPGETPSMSFIYGPLSVAMREGHILLINEIDVVDPSELMGLNDVLEGRPLVIEATGGELIHPHPNFRVIVTGNSTGSGDSTGHYQGVLMQNLAFLDRYRFCMVDYPEAAVEESILAKCTNHVPQIITNCVRVANEVRNLFKGSNGDGSTLAITLSTRTLVRWAKLAIRFRGAGNSMEYALNHALLNRASPEDKEAILRICKDVFGDQWK